MPNPANPRGTSEERIARQVSRFADGIVSKDIMESFFRIKALTTGVDKAKIMQELGPNGAKIIARLNALVVFLNATRPAGTPPYTNPLS